MTGSRPFCKAVSLSCKRKEGEAVMSDKRTIRREAADVLATEHTVLVVLDGIGEAYRTRIPQLVRAAHSCGVPVIFTEYHPLRRFGEPEVSAPNDALPLVKREDICIPRVNNSCFFGNCLHALLQKNKIETVVLCGGTTETSLYTSACEAQYHDYYTCVVPDTASNEGEETGAYALALLQKRYRIIDAMTITALWSSGSRACCAAVVPAEKRLDPEHTALVVVDMQKDFCDSDGEYARTRDVSAVQKIIPVIRALVDDAHRNGVLVLYFSQFTPRDDHADNGASLAFKTRDGKKASYALEGSVGQEYIDALPLADADIVVPKLRSNGFHDTWMEKILHANAITHLVVTGTQTEWCVLGTMMGAEQNGFTVIPVADGMETSVADVQEPALRLIDHRFKLWSAQNVMTAWHRAKK